jgi:manganese/zinc/iron transport system substrate-binding protein
LAGCSTATVDSGSGAQPTGDATAITVYATTGYIADAVRNVAPDAEIITMVGPGGDPHTYQPSTQDIEQLEASDVVFSTGLYLEAQMVDVLEGLGDTHVAVGEQVSEELLLPWPETDPEGNALNDPHIWNSPEAWSQVVQVISDELAEINPDLASTYADNGAAYITQIQDLAASSEEQLADLQTDLLVTGHDAFNYFGQTFGLEVLATDFVSSEAQLSPQELSELADVIVANEVPVIFQDNLANPQAIESLQEAVQAQGWEVQISDEELFADSLGDQSPTDTYLGAFEHNVAAVAAALGA